MKLNTYGVAAAALVTLCASVFAVSSSHSVQAQEEAQAGAANSNTLAQRLIGTWRLEEAERPGSPSGIGTRLKMFTGTHWCVIQPDPETGLIVFQHGGRYELEDDTMRTTIDFAGESTKALIGGKGKVKLEIEKSTMKQADSEGVFNETWKRLE